MTLLEERTRIDNMQQDIALKRDPRKENEAGITAADFPFHDADPFGLYPVSVTGKHAFDRLGGKTETGKWAIRHEISCRTYEEGCRQSSPGLDATGKSSAGRSNSSCRPVIHSAQKNMVAECHARSGSSKIEPCLKTVLARRAGMGSSGRS